MISMNVVKRNGKTESVSFDKVLHRIQKAATGLAVNPTLIAQRTLLRIYDGVKTSELDELAAQLSISLMTTHLDYGTLASRIAISNHHQNTSDKFTEVVFELANQTIDKTGEPWCSVSQELVDLCATYGETINAKIDYERDYQFDYFGFKTLEKLQYLLRTTKGKTVERPQHLIMRVSLALWGSISLDKAFETYDLLSQKYFIHATPTNFNAGTPRQQLSSCFLLAMKEKDSIVGIYDTLKDCALISKHAGGIGLHIHDIRAKGSFIRGTNGMSNGIVPMLRNFNDTARYVDQCFTPDTLVHTEQGHKPISTILPGERVLTSDGYHTVLKQVVHSYSGRMWAIQLKEHSVPVIVTEEHPICSVRTQGQPWETVRSQIHAGLVEQEYHEVKELSVGDRTVFPGQVYAEIESIVPIQYAGPVYDFEIDGPHDYTVTHLGIAHNGGGKRNGSFAIYLEPWHADVEDFLKLKLNTGSEEERCRDLFYALWIPDLFMERVERNEPWTLFCPSEAPGLSDVYGEEFNALYLRYEKEGRGKKQIDAQKLWFKVLDAQIETGTPYLLYKDAANKKSNQKNVGTIKSSNLCSEIIEYSNEKETAVCNLASIALPTYVTNQTFDYNKLRQVVKVAIRNLNRVIDINYYPTPETKTSNLRHRPVGLGVQGLADVFAMLRVPWESEQAAEINQRIFEHIYYAAMESSCEIAQEEGPYPTFRDAELGDSPLSKGIFQYDMWTKANGDAIVPLTCADGTLEWASLKARVIQYGVRNSLLVAPMPTASTSQILGFNECFESFTSNIYTRRTLAGEFIVINKHLMRELEERGLWNEMMKQQIIARNGSVQGIDQIPEEIQQLYKTSWEIKQKTLIDMAAARGAFICQSQSLNLFVADPNYAKLTSMHFYAWKQGLKTGMYYLRTRAPVMAQKFTIDPELQKEAAHSEQMRMIRKNSEEECTMCSS